MSDAKTLNRPEIFAQLAQAKFTSVLWLGAGEATSPELSALQADQLRLVDPDPTLAKALRHALQDNKTAEVIEAAVSDTSGRGVLQRYNLSAANALRAPSGLRDLFPNLQQTGNLEVDTQDISALLDGLDLAANADHLLILEAPGETSTVMKTLINAAPPAARLADFSHLLLSIAPEPLYEGETSGAELLALLTTAGFVLEARDDTDPDRPLAYLTRDKARLALESDRDEWQIRHNEAETTIETLRRDLETLGQTHAVVTKDIKRLRQERTRANQARKAAEKERDTLRSGSVDEAERLRAERDTAKKALSAAQKKCDELGQQIDAEKARAASRESAQNNKNAQELARLRSERDTVKKLQTETKAECDALRTDVENLKARSRDIETLQDNLTVALRTQALREADLVELRDRYTAQSREKAALEQALRDLAGDVQTALTHLNTPAASKPAPGKTPSRKKTT